MNFSSRQFLLHVSPKVILFWFYDPNNIVCRVQTAKSYACGSLTLKQTSVVKAVGVEIVAMLKTSKRFLKYVEANQCVC